MLISSAVSISLSFAQGSNIEKKMPVGVPVKSKALGVKIIFPTQGQRVFGGKNLTLTGTSTNDNHKCLVSIIVNNIKPYQRVIATGHNGTNDYSTWKFPLSTEYTALKAGLENKATAKLTCIGKPTNLTKYYSVNFTSSSSSSHVKLSSLEDGSNATSINTSKTEPLSFARESTRPTTSPIASNEEHNKMLKDQQKLHTETVPSAGTQDNNKPEATTMSNNSTMNEVKTPFVLSTPSSVK